MAASSSVAATPKGPQVFISFRGDDVRKNFLSFLSHEMRAANINVFIDEDAMVGTDLSDLLVRIEESKVALVIFSKEYTTSDWCLDELDKIKECKEKGTLKVVPIFYRIDPSVVKNLRDEFGDNFRTMKHTHKHQPEKTRKWKEALKYIPLTTGIPLSQESDRTDKEFINTIVTKIQSLLASMTVVPIKETEVKANKQGGSVVPPLIPARQLQITHSRKPRHWVWSTIYDPTTYVALEIVKMTEIYWLNIVGTTETGELTPGTRYEAVFVVKLEDDACGWEEPVTLQLKVEQHDGSDNLVDRTSNLKEYIGHDWVDILAGVFVVPPSNAPAKITFTMCQYEIDDCKNGLVVKGVAIRPTN